MKTIHAVIAHDKEKQSDHLRGLYKSLEGAEKAKESIKTKYIKQIGVDDFDEFYSVRVEGWEVKE